ncbi:MAG: zf-HC2 domain-containing protein [Candidatus Omnitrophica bacterium]|nr:zf-HC2 domain-containing protein [Candidatus Omnitrophota bacterium]
MRCEDILRCLADYLEEDLDALTESCFLDHLEECARCSALLHTLEKTIFLSRNIWSRQLSPPRQVIRRVYYQVRIHYRHR